DSFGVSPESFHIIGHSLGTEVAGYAGERINRLGRITVKCFSRNPVTNLIAFRRGCSICRQYFVFEEQSKTFSYRKSDPDPAGPYFRNVSPSARNLVVCDHYKVIDYFLATIPNHYGCKPVAVACDSWEKFTAGKCSDCATDGSQCATMGFRADAKKDVIKQHRPKKFYLYTSPNPPFCVQHYHISVKITDNGWAQELVGEIEIILKGRYGSKTVNIDKRNGLQDNCHHPEDIDVKSIAFRWTCATFKLSDSIKISIDTQADTCRLCLHSVIITTYTTSLT
ncbi:pancreatic triacylglycerol lipase, partial [Caerostris extrusa]